MKNSILIALCFIAGLAGANVQPLLTGAGKILFPENATPATISASSGALTISAGGSNQNVILTPSGTGTNVLTSRASVNTTDTTRGALEVLQVADTSAGGIALLNNAASMRLWQDVSGVGYISQGSAGNAPLVLNIGGGLVGIGNIPATYPLDVTGDINASGVFRKGGTAGTGGNTLFTVCTSGACITSCTLQFNGGIRVGGTCP